MKQGARPTLKAIAKQSGISVTTVSRALNGKAEAYGISKKTEEAVLRAAKEMHLSPDPLALGLRLNRTLSIGLLIPDISNPYVAETARNVESAARRGSDQQQRKCKYTHRSHSHDWIPFLSLVSS